MSCKTELIEAINDWTSIPNTGSSQIDAIVLDFSKAFDMIHHIRLTEKLKSYGITGSTRKLIHGFLNLLPMRL